MTGSHLTLVKDVAQAIQATWDAHAACAVSLEVLCEHFDFAAGLLWTPRDDDTFRVSHVHTRAGDTAAAAFADRVGGLACRPGDGVLGSLLAAKASSATWAVDSADDAVSRALADAGYAAATAYTVQSRGRCAALLQVALEERERPAPDVLAALETVAIQLGHVVERVEAREELVEREDRIRRILDSSADAFVSIDARGRVSDWNRTAEELLGWSADEIVGRPVTDTLLTDELVARYRDEVAALFATGQSTIARHPLEVTLRRRDGSRFVAEAMLWQTDVGGGRRVVSAFLRDVSEARRRERQLAAQRQQLAHAQQLAKVGSWDWNARTDELMWSEQYLANMGLPPDTGPSYELLLARVHPADRERFVDVLDRAHETREDFSMEYRVVTPGGDLRRMRTIGRVEVAADGTLLGTWGAVQDITEEHELRELIRHRSRHDHLTDLSNRPAFQETIQSAIERHDDDRCVVVALLDLDHFSDVNDRLGTAGGDATIVALAERLRDGLAPYRSLAARTGGDEFGVVAVLDHPGPEEVHAFASHLHALVSAPVEVEGRTFALTTSIGLATDRESGDDADVLLRDADVALNMAKARGGQVTQVFQAKMHEEALAQLALRADLQRAVDQRDIEPHYQAVVSLTTGQAVGFEALARWERPGHGPVSPGVFVPLLEELGLVGELGAQMLERACADLAAFRRARPGAGDLSVAVNLSPHQLDDPGLVELVRRALADAGLPAEALVLEVTESTLAADDSRAAARLWELARLGVRLAIDDFGTGYSSLGRLRDYPAHLLKIDRSFLKDIRSDDDEPAILGALFAMARTLGLAVVAEGVETAAQLAVVLRHGGDEVQGFLFGAAIPAPHVHRLLDDPSWDLDVAAGQGGDAAATTGDAAGASPHQHLEASLRALARDPAHDRLDQVLADVAGITGLASVFLTRVNLRDEQQRVVRAVNRGPIEVPADADLDWSRSPCRWALGEERRHIEDVPGTCPGSPAADLGIVGYLSVPVYGSDGSFFGTLCGGYPATSRIREGTVDLLELVGRSVTPYVDRMETSGRRP